ncbi:MAG: DUF4298 domain-containing protein [Christensenellaceae bacterium]|nr:DUF4298 domain-containing protein [Christensenellaceae bacterium]
MNEERERMDKAFKQNEIAKADNDKLSEALNLLKNAQTNIKELSDYYFNQWFDDLEVLEKEGFSNGVMDQDTLYETIQNQYIIVKKLLLECAMYINNDNF